jgi:uncharacterized protein
MRTTALGLLCAILVSVAAHGFARAQGQIALVIGNSAYDRAPSLKNPSNDAIDISRAVRALGFEVFEGVDLNKEQFLRLVERFEQRAQTASVTLLFFAGHGVQVGGSNYLLPTDTLLRQEQDLVAGAIKLDTLLERVRGKAPVTLVFLDACRDNPLAKGMPDNRKSVRAGGVTTGLAAVVSRPGTLIAFATQPDNVAYDGAARNSPFTLALLNRLPRKGNDISDVLRGVTRDVMSSTAGRQVPWSHSSLTQGYIIGREFELRKAPLHACDQAAAHPEDKERVAAGVVDEKLDAVSAAEHCKKALTEFKKVPRFEYQLARALSAQAKHEEAFALYRSSAEQGHIQSYKHVVEAYFLGTGTKVNVSEGFRWVKASAEKEDPRTALFMGMTALGLSKHTKDEKQSAAQGVELIIKAANWDHVPAMLTLGALYEGGIKVDKDFEKAADWYLRAAEQGDATAAAQLGSLYMRGLGLGTDAQQARLLFEAGAKANNAFAMLALGALYHQGRGMQTDFAKAAYWYTEAAARGNATAMHALFVLHLKGEGVPRNNAQALTWLTKSAEKGFDQAMHALGYAYYSGEYDVKQDYASAMSWFRRAADKGYPDSMLALAVGYDKGRGLEKSPKDALAWMEKAAARGNGNAMIGLASKYERGDGVVQDYKRSAQWYRSAADGGSSYAYYKLAVFFERGLGASKDSKVSAQLFLRAAEKEAYWAASGGRKPEPAKSSGEEFSLAVMLREARTWSAEFVRELRTLLREQGHSSAAESSIGEFDDGLVSTITALGGRPRR